MGKSNEMLITEEITLAYLALFQTCCPMHVKSQHHITSLEHNSPDRAKVYPLPRPIFSQSFLPLLYSRAPDCKFDAAMVWRVIKSLMEKKQQRLQKDCNLNSNWFSMKRRNHFLPSNWRLCSAPN